MRLKTKMSLAMKKVLVLLTVAILGFNCSFSQDEPNDAFEMILSELNLTAEDLGYRPKGYWTRYPVPSDIPYKMTSFDDLMSEPQRIYDFVQTMAKASENYLAPEFMEKNTTGLLKTVFYCGVQHLTSQFRPYNASLWAEPDAKKPMISALKEIHRFSRSEWRFNRFGQAADFPLVEEEYEAELKNLHPKLREALAPTLIHLLSAYKFRQIAMRNVDWKDAVDCWRVRKLGETQFDGMEYYPYMEDCAQNLDLNSIIYAGYKLLESSQILVKAIDKLAGDTLEIDWTKQNANFNTPIGKIVISGSGDDVHRDEDVLLSLDLGGDDKYYGSAGATNSLFNGVSLYIDMDGDDEYINDDELKPAQGAAVFGASLLLDMNGDDIYKSTRLSQGAAMFGFGVLADMNGADKYEMQTSGQGGAYFGVGTLIDVNGEDAYKLWGDGQGYGGVGGAGALVDINGDDRYEAVYKSEEVHRPDYHSKDGVHNYTYCQGSGVGRRGDITDGHSWAGGIGTLIDINGADEYISGNWSQGSGYWYGMGFLYDKNGNDIYKSTTWSMASGAHFGISGLIDEWGDDKFEIWYERGVGMGFGHDYVVSLFLNKGGDDSYKLQENGLGYAINMSQIFFFDLDGNDIYLTGKKGDNYGWNNYKKSSNPKPNAMYHLYSNQISVFADVGGDDVYKQIEVETMQTTQDERMGDGAKIFYPTNAERKELKNKRFYGIGIDFQIPPDGEIYYFKDKYEREE